MKECSSPGLRTSYKDRLIVLSLDGEIDLNVLPDVTSALNRMIAKKPQQLVVDLSRVTYIDSAGVAALIQAMQGGEAYRRKFPLAPFPGNRASVFQNSPPCWGFYIFSRVGTPQSWDTPALSHH